MNATYFNALAFDYEMGRSQGIDATLKMNNLDALLLPTDGVYLCLSMPIYTYQCYVLPDRIYFSPCSHRWVSTCDWLAYLLPFVDVQVIFIKLLYSTTRLPACQCQRHSCHSSGGERSWAAVRHHFYGYRVQRA